MFNKPILYLIFVSSIFIKQNSSFAQTIQQFECSYKATGRLSLTNFGTLPPDTILSINWAFKINGENGVIPTNESQAAVESGEIIFSHTTEGSLTYTIDKVTVRDFIYQDSVVTSYSKPQGQLGGVDPGPNNQNLTLTNGNEATGVYDILTNQNYPLNSDTLNRFTGRGANITQIDFNGIIRTVALGVSPITGGCSQITGKHFFMVPLKNGKGVIFEL